MATREQSLEAIIERVYEAQRRFAVYAQERVDAVFHHAATAATAKRIELAKMAVEETGMGVLEDKVIKNHFASEFIYNKYKDAKTCGIIADDPVDGYREIAAPLGIVAGIVPTTNPTSTAIFKALLCLKTRNGIIFSPHPRARVSTAAAAAVIHEAAVAAGAPEGIIACLENPSVEMTQALMGHRRISLVLATGGPGMVRAAYSSGTPAIGVGAGNTPVVIDATADVKMAVNSILLSKTFDNGMICASEQTVVAEGSIADAVREEFLKRGAFFADKEQTDALAGVIFRDGSLNGAIVGQSAARIAAMAGVAVPENTRVLLAERGEIKADDPFAHEKLSPVLGFYRAPDFASAVEMAQRLVLLAGAGHTAVLYTRETNRQHVELFQNTISTGRILINMPASQGAIGDVYNFRVAPSLTLGCGSWGGNSVSENIGVKHLMNVKTVACRRENMLWFRVPPKIYYKQGALRPALEEFRDKNRAVIVTDSTMEQLGHVRKVVEVLEDMDMEFRVFSGVLPDPDMSAVRRALDMVNDFKPDMFIALGGGSPMDAAKIIWLLYEVPDIRFDDIALRFMDIRKRVASFPALGRKAVMVAVPTTSGTGSEVTPFAVITDDRTGVKYPVADYALTPDMAIVDPEFVLDLPHSLIANAGLDVLTHALEAYTSTLSTNFSDAPAMEAIRLIFKYLRRSYEGGEDRFVPREKIHYAATIAGMAFANAFLGVCHSLAHALGSFFHLPHGLANAIMLSYVIEYNATDVPTKQGMLPQYKYPWVKGRYARIADLLHLAADVKGDSAEARAEKTARLVRAIESLKRDLSIPASLREAGIAEAEFLQKLDMLAEQAFDDQCTGSNPRYPLISELKELYRKAYYGEPLESCRQGGKDVC
ncbi:MAG: bifunctional acetaldehyde-CoA/alcohol dehydrogenase [Desulfovibrio sp.]|jgi:acetaldehyde dehydrogenase/alcohol dehydrogenase|nr:bifunctional acetaldehyde-CoA/alcohol dehydrogenase [Desulfovibrio sp.]